MSDLPQPLICQWDGEAFVPATPYQAKLADERFVVGERYAMVEHHERSSASHAHYFATLHDLWLNLPENRDRVAEATALVRAELRHLERPHHRRQLRAVHHRNHGDGRRLRI